MNPKFEIFKDTSNQFRFRLKARNGEIILASEAYTAKHNCENGIESVRTHSQSLDNFDKLTSIAEEPYFNLVADNDEVIGTSEMYSSIQARDNGIDSVMTNAPIAGVEDLSY